MQISSVPRVLVDSPNPLGDASTASLYNSTPTCANVQLSVRLTVSIDYESVQPPIQHYNSLYNYVTMKRQIASVPRVLFDSPNPLGDTS